MSEFFSELAMEWMLVLGGAWFISAAIDRLKAEKYFAFGVWLSWFVIIMITAAKFVFERFD